MALSASAVFADNEDRNVYIMAEELNQLGLLKGVGKGNYEMSRAPTRAESVVMVIRLLGKENDALKSGGNANPFYDVPDWAEKYISYASGEGLVKGVSEGFFGANLPVDSKQYITFLLRALKYSDDEGDFTYEDSKDFAASIGLLDGYRDSGIFLRSDMIFLSHNALNTAFNNSESDFTLAQSLIESGVFSYSQWERATAVGETIKIPRNDYEWKEIKYITAESKEDMYTSFKKAMNELPFEVIIFVPTWKEKEYMDYISAKSVHLIKYAREFQTMYSYGSGRINIKVIYSKGYQCMAYLQNPTVPVGDDIKELAMKGFNIYKDKFEHISTEYKLVRAIHDYIADSLVYDERERPESSDLDGALNTGRATCGGYSAMFQFFTFIGGLDCEMVYGTSINRKGQVENHAWNVVKVDGNWYNIDVTWDDPVTNTGEQIIRHNYFLISDSVLAKDHTWERSFYPAARSSWE